MYPPAQQVSWRRTVVAQLREGGRRGLFLRGAGRVSFLCQPGGGVGKRLYRNFSACG